MDTGPVRLHIVDPTSLVVAVRSRELQNQKLTLPLLCRALNGVVDAFLDLGMNLSRHEDLMEACSLRLLDPHAFKRLLRLGHVFVVGDFPQILRSQ